MTRRHSYVLVLFAIGSLFVSEAIRAEPNAAETLWFEVGEETVYRLYWGIIPVGEASVSTGWIEKDDRKLLSLKMRAKTGRIVSAIYPVDDFVESIVDPKTFLPVSFTQKLREGKRVRNETSVFDHSAGIAHWTSHLDGSTTNIVIAADTRDILCLIFYMRSQAFGIGSQKKLKVLVDEQLYDLVVTGLKREEVYLAKFGYIDCLKVEPKAKFGEVFVRKGTMMMWFCQDGRRLCTRITAKTPVAKVKAILRSVKGPGGDFWTSGKRGRRRRKK